jgi:hypothetical protein
MVKEDQGKHVLPIRAQRTLYDDFSRNFISNIANDENQIADAEVEAVELENAEDNSENFDEFEDDGSSSKIVS